MHLFCMPWCFGISTHCGIANWSTKQLLLSFSFEYPGFKRMAQPKDATTLFLPHPPLNLRQSLSVWLWVTRNSQIQWPLSPGSCD